MLHDKSRDERRLDGRKGNHNDHAERPQIDVGDQSGQQRETQQAKVGE
jgi:hypothetical protein